MSGKKLKLRGQWTNSTLACAVVFVTGLLTAGASADTGHEEALGNALSGLGDSMGKGIIEHARQLGLELPPQLDDPNAEITPQTIIDVLSQVTRHYFPLLAPDASHSENP